MVVCVLGAASSGKTSLLKKICGEDDITPLTKSLPTVGISHFKVGITTVINGHKKKKLKQNFTVQEVGGELAQNWCSYLKNVSNLIYFIDCSNLNLVSEVAYHLINCLETLSKESEKNHVLIVFSKKDLVGSNLDLRLKELRTLIRLSHLVGWYKNIKISEITTNCWTEEGIPEIKNWIKERGEAEN